MNTLYFICTRSWLIVHELPDIRFYTNSNNSPTKIYNNKW